MVHFHVQGFIGQCLNFLIAVVGGIEQMAVLIGPEEIVAGVVEPAPECLQMQGKPLFDQRRRAPVGPRYFLDRRSDADLVEVLLDQQRCGFHPVRLIKGN